MAISPVDPKNLATAAWEDFCKNAPARAIVLL
jgi:hypothetical protein